MEYLALIYADESGWEAQAEADREAVMQRYIALSREGGEAGVIVDGAELSPTRDATTVRVRDNQSIVTDGPYAEAKEALGGYFVLDCASIDEAVAWAARIPGAETGAVEVRPVHIDAGEA